MKAQVAMLWRWRCVASLAALVGCLMLATSAGARVVFTRAWGWGVSDGASHFETCTVTCHKGRMGAGAGGLSDPQDVASDASADVYVVDTGNNRIDEFSGGTTFVRAWGWGVSDGLSKFEVCTAVCLRGTSGGGAGQFDNVLGVAVDPSGEVYVGDGNNQRIQEFSPTGGLVRTWGWGVADGMSQPELCTTICQSGIFGGGAGQFHEPVGVAADSTGDVYVADLANYRIDEFSGGSTFIRTWGWGVSDGMSRLETCTSSCQAGVDGAGAGQLFNAPGVAADSSGHVYVADDPNQRVDEFSATGGFIKAWGWGVKDGAHRFETCTNSCQAGVGGGGVGQLYYPADVATDTSGHVYVDDAGNSRIDEFSTGGRFIKAWGWGVTDGARRFETCTTACRTGLHGGHAGQLYVPTGLGIGPSGRVYVADQTNQRIDEFTLVPPQTRITSGPGNGARTTDRTPTFGFRSSESGSHFQCKLDSGAFKRCRPPDTLGRLSLGSHTFEVRAIDQARDIDPTPAGRTFKVVR